MKTSLRSPATPHGRVFLAGFLALFSAGCLTWEKQTILVTFPKEQNELRILIVYHGLGVAGKDAKQLENAKTQLSLLVNRDGFFLGDSTLLGVSLKLGKNDELNAQKLQALKVLKHHVVIDEGMFVTGKNNSLSFCQPLTVRDPVRFTVWLNQMIREELVPLLKSRKDDSFWDDETVRMVQEAADKEIPFVRYEPGRFSLTVAGTHKFFAKLKRSFLDENKVWTTEDWRAFANSFANTPLSLVQGSDQITLSLGWGGNQPFRVTTESNGRSVDTMDLQAFARTLKAPFRNDISLEKVLDDFEQTQVLALPAK